MSWNYKQPDEPHSEEVAKENNGYALEDLYDANGTLLARKGQLLSSFALLRDEGEFPYVGTTYRLTEHFHTWTKHALLNAIAQPGQFVEISETLAAAKGIANGDYVKVSSKRGVGIPIHWGFEGVARKGYIANTLTPNVGDANSQTPEYKAFLVNIEKA